MKEKLKNAFIKHLVIGNSKWRNKNEVHVITDKGTDIEINIKNNNPGIYLGIPDTYYIKDCNQNSEHEITKGEYEELSGKFDDSYEI